MFTGMNKSFIVLSHVGVKASRVFVSFKLSRVSNHFTLHASYCHQGCISKVPVGKQPWRNVGLAVSIGWSKDQGCCDKNTTAPGSQALKTWIPSIPLPLVLECLTPSDVWHLMKGVRKASGTSAVTSLFLLSAAHHHISWLWPIVPWSFLTSAFSWKTTSKQIPSWDVMLQKIHLLLYTLLNTDNTLFVKFRRMPQWHQKS